MKIADEITLDHKDGSIRINGETFPYYVGQEIDVKPSEYAGCPAVVTVQIWADDVRLVTKDGTVSHIASSSEEIDHAWAAARAAAVGLDGSGDVIRFIEAGMP